MARIDPAPWTSAQALENVRPQVRDMLTKIPSFGELDPAERRELAGAMVKVLSYIADPNGVSDALPSQPLSAGQPAAAGAIAAGIPRSRVHGDLLDPRWLPNC